MVGNLGDCALLAALGVLPDVLSCARPPVAMLKEQEGLYGPQVASARSGMYGFDEWGSMNSGNICVIWQAPWQSRVGVG